MGLVHIDIHADELESVDLEHIGPGIFEKPDRTPIGIASNRRRVSAPHCEVRETDRRHKDEEQRPEDRFALPLHGSFSCFDGSWIVNLAHSYSIAVT